jgi:hypothetical protein
MRQVATAAVTALGYSPTPGSVWRFAWDWWYQRSADELIAFQSDRLTPHWAAENVLAPAQLPPAGSILLSMHQYNLAVAAARAVQLVDALGVVSVIDVVGTQAEAEATAADGFLLPRGARERALAEFYARTFGSRLYPPTMAARRGLDLLRRGGSLIVLPEFYGDVCGPILGRAISVAPGATWLSQHSGRPIVPFLLHPPRRSREKWRLWCGAPIEASYEAIVATLEWCIRRMPSSWPYWRGWYAAPAWLASEVRPVHQPPRRLRSRG